MATQVQHAAAPKVGHRAPKAGTRAIQQAAQLGAQQGAKRAAQRAALQAAQQAVQQAAQPTAQPTAQQAAQQAAQQQEELVKHYIAKIHYSDRYSDDEFEYRHVILPKQLFKMLPKAYFKPDESGTLRLLADEEWRGIGIQQSLGWEHYEVHAPEPHVLLFRRACEPLEPEPEPEPELELELELELEPELESSEPLEPPTRFGRR